MIAFAGRPIREKSYDEWSKQWWGANVDNAVGRIQKKKLSWVDAYLSITAIDIS